MFLQSNTKKQKTIAELKNRLSTRRTHWEDSYHLSEEEYYNKWRHMGSGAEWRLTILKIFKHKYNNLEWIKENHPEDLI